MPRAPWGANACHTFRVWCHMVPYSDRHLTLYWNTNNRDIEHEQANNALYRKINGHLEIENLDEAIWRRWLPLPVIPADRVPYGAILWQTP